jgi:alpha-glucoside transport system permease protein
MNRILLGLIVVFGVPAATVLYAWLAEKILSVMPDSVSRRLRPWFWIGPALFLLGVYLIYPTVETIVLSFMNAQGTKSFGFTNFKYVFTNPAMLISFRNNIIWMIIYPTVTLAIALLIAVLADRVWYENIVKAVVFIPMAISFVAAGIIWKLQYDWQPPGIPQTGTANAIVTSVGGQPVTWLQTQPINNVALIVIGIWMYAGFATVILSAGLKSIPVELLEASRIDGANEWQIFRGITLPLLSSTIAVVATTMIISVLKIFDIVYVMTNGNFNTDVIANRMYKELFTFHNLGRASAISTILLLLTIPVMIYNIRRFQSQEELR